MSVFSRSHRGQMSDSMLTAAFIILSGGLQDAYTYLCRGKVYANAIPRNVRLAEAPSHGLPVIAYDRSSRGAAAYLAVAEEIRRKDGSL